METPAAVRMTRSQARAMAESGGSPLATPVAESTRKRSTRTASKLKPEATDAEDALYDATIPMSALDEPMMLAKETLMQAPIAETSFLSPRKALGDVTNSGLEGGKTPGKTPTGKLKGAEAVQLIVVKTPAKTPLATLAAAKTPLAKTPSAMATAKCLQIFEDEAVVAPAEDAAPEEEVSEPAQEEEEEASEPVQMKTPAAKTPAAKTPAAKTPATNIRRSTRLASAMKGNKTPEPAAEEAEVLAAASPVEEHEEEEEAVVLAPASPAQEVEAPLSLITESLEVEEVEEVSVEVPSQRELFQELEELEAVEVEKDVVEVEVAMPLTPVQLAEEAFVASLVSGAIGRSLEMPASPLVEAAAADLSSKSPAPLVWEADEETFSESDADLCLAAGPAAEAHDDHDDVAAEGAGEKSPSLRQLRAQIKDLSMASRGRWMDNGVDLAGEDHAGDDVSAAPRQVASSVSQVEEENADEALAGMQERLKADRQAQRAQQKGQDRHMKRMKARTNRTARAEKQMEAGEAEGAEAVAWANSRVDVRGQPAFGGAHMRFNATTGQPCTSPGNVPTPYVTPACSPDRYGYEFVGDDGLEAFQAEGLFDDDDQSQDDEDDSSDCSTGAVVNTNTLPRRTPLKGMKGSEGMHLRYDEETEAAQESPTNGAVRLRGVTVATGGHMRFDKK